MFSHQGNLGQIPAPGYTHTYTQTSAPTVLKYVYLALRGLSLKKKYIGPDVLLLTDAC